MVDQPNLMPTANEIAAVNAVVAEKRGWFISVGIVLVVLGIIAMGSPIFTTIAAKVLLGWLILFAGIAQVIRAFLSRNWKGFWGNIIVGLLYVIVGAWLAFYPLAGIIALTVLIAILFIAEGIFQIGIAFQVRPVGGWIWVGVSGVVAIVVGGLIFLGLPSSAKWAIGLLVGINLLMTGWSYLMLSFFARTAS